MAMESSVSKAVRQGLLATTLGSLAWMSAGTAMAEEAPAAKDDVERIEVTGSRIKRTDLETASPVVVIGADTIEKGGFNSVQDVLDNLSQNSGGSMTQQEVHGFTPAASAVNLRGIGAGRVLTLINGKRVPKYPFGAGGTDNFVDTANLPLGAIDRIEVLTTGASAIYGSDAMGGVINIILKQDVDETTVKARLSDTEDGGMARNHIQFLTGTTNDDSNVTFFIEYEDREALKGADRPEWGTDIIDNNYYAGYSSYGANLYRPDGTFKSLSTQECIERGLQPLADGRCGFDRSAMRDFMPEQKRLSTMVNFTQDLSPDHQLYGRMDYTHSEVYREIEPSAIDDYTFTVVGDDVIVSADAFPDSMVQRIEGAALAGSQAFNGDFAGASEGDYYYSRRLLELGPRRSTFETNNFSFLTGIKGYLTDSLEYDASYSFSRQKVNTVSEGSPTVQGMFNYIVSDGGHSLLDAISPEDAAMMAYQGFKRGESSLSLFSFGLSGDAFELPGGTAGFATGVELSREWFFSADDSFTSAGGVLGTGGSSAEGSRKQYAGYAELAMPIIEPLTVTVAGRYDYYDDASDVGGRFTPQVAVEYRPFRDLLVRGLYAETFRAPDMQRLFGDPTNAFTTVVDTPRCNAAGGPGSGAPECDKIESLPITIGANPDLKEETGTNWNLGAVYSIADWTFQLDYWSVTVDDIVNDPSAQYILDNAEAFEDKIIRDDNGELVRIDTVAINMSSQETSGLDFKVNYDLGTQIGDFKFEVNGTYLLSYEYQINANSAVEDGLEGDGSLPELRGNFIAGWNRGNFGANVLVKYIGEHNGYYYEGFKEAGLDSDYNVDLDSHVEVNLTGSYTLDNWRFTAGINNLFEAEPEVDGSNPSWPHFDRSYYSVVGREYFVSGEFTF